jgi:hypothetical protein
MKNRRQWLQAADQLMFGVFQGRKELMRLHSQMVALRVFPMRAIHENIS